MTAESFDNVLDVALRQRLDQHPEWEPETVRNVLLAAQRVVYGSRTLAAIAAAWPRFAADPGALLHSFVYRSGPWWVLPVAPQVSAGAELHTAPSTSIVAMSPPTPPEHGIDTTVEEFLEPAAAGDLPDQLAVRQLRVSPAIPLGAEFVRVIATERDAADRRRTLAVGLVLDEGWSYARLGRTLGITRQAAAKTYGPLVTVEMRNRSRAAGE